VNTRSAALVILVALLIVFIGTVYNLSTSFEEEPEDVVESVPSQSSLDVNCLECHSEENGNGIDPGTDWVTSVHGEVGTTCADCHGGDPSQDNISGSMIGTGFIGKPRSIDIPRICGQCHTKEYREYTESVHDSMMYKEGSEEPVFAATCSDCHGTHHIERSTNPESPVYFKNQPDTCGQCHEVYAYSYRDSYHGAYFELGSEVVAECPDCHTHHSIRPSGDPNSSISDENLPDTCAQCHDNDLNLDIAQGYQHDTGDLGEQSDSYFLGPFDLREWIPLLYKIIIVLTMVGLLSLIVLEQKGKAIGRWYVKWRMRKRISRDSD